MKYLKDCDLIIYDLHNGNPLDVELALEALKKKNKDGEEEKEKVLILISSLMAWSGTPRKVKVAAKAPTPKLEDGNEEGGEEAAAEDEKPKEPSE